MRPRISPDARTTALEHGPDIGRSRWFGRLGQSPASPRQLQFDTSSEDWRLIYALLELSRTTNDRNFLKLACRIADNLLKSQTKTGLFPRSGRKYARTSDQVPLAILHLAAALDGRDSLIPPAILDNAYFHCQYDGATVPKKPNIDDQRTHDSTVFYGAF
ncbi:MAG: hypothetical protein DME25_01695 [Verrucomicrobia bacterium]|nr:MAG: hypothetical protein DME25_01695 [Verrucomicrobiota bacterium]